MRSSRPGSLYCAGLIWLALVPSTLSAAALDPKEVANRTWIDVSTEHFAILTDGPEATASSLGRRLGQFCEMLHALHPGLRTYPTLPLDVYLFHDEAGMVQFSSSHLENVSGFATTAPGRNVFVMNSQVEGTDRAAVACHEFTHVFLHANFQEMPIWLNEGLAQYYETFRVRGHKAEFGHRHDWIPEWLNTHEWADMSLLFTMNAQASKNDSYTEDNNLRTTTYAQGWAIAHYLQARPDRSARFDSVLTALRQGMPPRSAFRTQFPLEQWPTLVEEVRRYVKDGMFDARSVALPEALQSPATKSRTVPAAEALVRLGDLLLCQGDNRLEDARRLYSEALAVDSSQARALAGLGYTEDVGSDSARAEVSYARAEAMAPDDARIDLLAGDGMLERVRAMFQSGVRSRSRMHEIMVAARRRFAHCLSIEENNPEALAGFGKTFLAEGLMPDAAYHSIALAADALPARTDLWKDLAMAREIREHTKAAQAADSSATAPVGSGKPH